MNRLNFSRSLAQVSSRDFSDAICSHAYLAKTLRAKLSVCILALVVPGVSFADTVSYNFGTATPFTASYTSGPIGNTTDSDVSAGNNGTAPLLSSTSASSGYTGASGNGNAGAAATTGALSLTSSAYFQLTLTPSSGYSLNLTGISFGERSTSTGPTTITIEESVGSGSYSPVATFAVTNGGVWALEANTGLNLTSTSAISLRIYGSGGAGSAGTSTANYRIDDLSIIGTTTSTGGPPPPTLYSYFDLNGATVGSGIANNSTNSFTGSGTNFNSVAAGTGTTGAFTNDGTATATFSAGTDSAANTYTVNIDEAVMTKGITFTDANVTLAHATGGSLTLTGPSVSVATGGMATISEAIGGTVGLTKDGGGMLTLSNTTSGFTGTVTVDSGILSIGADTNLGTSTNAVALNGGTLQMTTGISNSRGFTGTGALDIAPSTTFTSTGAFNTAGVTLTNTGTLSVTGTETGQSIGAITFNATSTVSNTGSTLAVGNVTVGAGSTGVATISGPISMANGTNTFAVPDTNSAGVDLAINGVISGTGSISKTGAGTLALNGNNIFSGSLQIGGTTTTGGMISVGNANGLGTGTFNFNDGTVSNDTGAVLTTPRVLSIGATGGTGVIGGATFAGSDIVVSGGVSFYSPSAATQVITVNNHTTFTGVVSTGSTASAGVTVNGSGTLTLNGSAPNTFVQPVTITGGATLEAGKAGALAANAGVTVNTGSTLLLSGTGANRINDSAAITLVGGTYASGGNSETTGALTLSSSSNIDFGVGSTGSVLTFADSSGKTWSGTLTLLNYTASSDALNFGTSTANGPATGGGLTASQLSEIQYTSGGVTFAGSGFDGSGDVTFTMVPEPATVFGGALFAGALGWSQRRRLRGFAGLRCSSVLAAGSSRKGGKRAARSVDRGAFAPRRVEVSERLPCPSFQSCTQLHLRTHLSGQLCWHGTVSK